MKEQLDWTKAIQLTKYTNLEKNVLSYLKICSENEQVVNLHCYIDEKIVKNSKKLIKKYRKAFNKRNYDKLFDACAEGNQGILQLLAPIMPNPNAPDKDGQTPIHIATFCKYGFEPIVHILAPLVPNPNACDKKGGTPILYAARDGNIGIIRFLIPLADNPNEPQNQGVTPIQAAAANGELEIVKILASLTNNCLNVTDKYGWTALHTAAVNGEIEITKFLAPLMDNLNARNEDGKTPIDLAKRKGHNEVVKFLESFERPASERPRLK